MRGTITVASVLIGVVAAGACSDEDKKKNAKGNPDAGADGSLAGDGGSAGSSTAGTGATGGSGGTTGGQGGTTGGQAGTTGGSAGTSGGSGGSGGTGGMMLICNTVDAGATGGSAGQGTGGSAGTTGSGGTAGTGTGGSAGSGPVGQWRDWDAWACRDCPAPTVSNCTDFDQAGASTFDFGTRIFTIEVKPGVAEVVSASYDIDWSYTDADGGYQYGTATGTMTVDRNTLTADLTSTMPAEVTYIYGVNITVIDACGTQNTIVYGVINDLNPDGSPVINIHCEM